MTIYPTPSPEGIAKLQEFYRRERALEISAEQACEILGGLMRFLYLTEVKPLSAEEEKTLASQASTRAKERRERP
jgi:hypothetical protein